MSFKNYKDHVEDGDIIISYTGSKKMQPVHISKQDILQTKFGAFPHNSLIGKQFGTKIYSKNKKRWIYLLHPTPELWTTILPHRTQILYTPDISMVLLQLNLKPGAIVVESGTGSGSMSHAIIRTIAPSGHLYTFEFHKQRAEIARTEFSRHGLADLVTVENKNVIEHGFDLDHVADAVFLDLPSPWDAIKTSKDALKVGGGNLCSFSPCIEQVQRTCEELQAQGFKDIRTMECLLRTYNVKTMVIKEPDFGSGKILKEKNCNTELLPRKRQHKDDDYSATTEEKQEQSLMPYTTKINTVANPEKIEMLKEETCNTEQLSRKREREDDDNGATTKEKQEQETETEISLMPYTMKRNTVANPVKIEMLKEETCNTEQLSRKRAREDDDNGATTKEKQETEISLMPYTMKRNTVANPVKIEMLKEETCNTEQLSRKRAREDDDNGATTKEKQEQETETEISRMPYRMKRPPVVIPENLKLATARVTKQVPGHTDWLS